MTPAASATPCITKHRGKSFAVVHSHPSSIRTETFMRLHRFFARSVSRSDVDANLTVRQIAVLTTIAGDFCTGSVKDYADYLRVSKPVISRALKRLSDLGLATRVVNQDDRRTVTITLTPRGEALAAAFGEDD